MHTNAPLPPYCAEQSFDERKIKGVELRLTPCDVQGDIKWSGIAAGADGKL